MKPLFSFILTLLAVPVVPAAAFTPDEAVRHAVVHDPDLTALRPLITEARARRLQAGRLSNPELDTEVRPHLNGREGVIALALIQRFPLTARLREERAVQDAEIVAAEAELHGAERRLAIRAALAVTEWLSARARLELLGRQLTNAQTAAAALQSAATNGEVSSFEARQLALEAGQLALRRRQIEQDLAMLRGELRTLLNLPAEEPLILTGSLLSDASWTLSLPPAGTNARPEIQIASARLETARRETRLARTQRWQDLGVGLVSELQRSEDAPDGLQRDDFVGLRLSLPLPFWDRNQGRIRETEARTERRQLELDAVRAGVRNEQATARELLELAIATERDWREQQLPQARQLEEQLLEQRAQGLVSFADWARARDRRLQAEASHLEARHALLRAWLQAQAALGEFPRFPFLP
jgi:outer membrane protein, heavy metal efflux system